jgi:hypothetical protein
MLDLGDEFGHRVPQGRLSSAMVMGPHSRGVGGGTGWREPEQVAKIRVRLGKRPRRSCQSF